jgi:hypothetical protein
MVLLVALVVIVRLPSPIVTGPRRERGFAGPLGSGPTKQRLGTTAVTTGHGLE